MSVVRIDPLIDPRWAAFVDAHPQATIFHAPAWLDALHRTYGYKPVAYILEEGRKIAGGIPFCHVKSLITGNRLVSVPFSDHCQPLVEAPEHLSQILVMTETEAALSRWKYVEIRPLSLPVDIYKPSGEFVVHKLDLTRSEEELLRSFHADCIRRKISKAEREGLRCEEGRSEDLLRKFYALLLMTRRRHGIPPQPLRWFRNLIDCLGEDVTISVAYKGAIPIASILTIRFKNTLIYKYGCSDPRYNALSGSIFLLWRAMQGGRQQGLTEMDLGRSDYSTPGLITFKDRWGAEKIPVQYYRSGNVITSSVSDSPWAAAARRVLTSVPDSMFCALGGLLYRHVG